MLKKQRSVPLNLWYIVTGGVQDTNNSKETMHDIGNIMFRCE